MAILTQKSMKFPSANDLLAYVNDPNQPLVHWKLYSGNATSNTQALMQTPDVEDYTKTESVELLQSTLSRFGNGTGKLRLLQNHKQRAANGVLVEFDMMPMQNPFGPSYGVMNVNNQTPATIGSVNAPQGYNNAIIGQIQSLQDAMHQKDLEMERMRREFERKESDRLLGELSEKLDDVYAELEGRKATFLTTIFNALNNESLAPSISGFFNALTAKLANVPMQVQPSINGVGRVTKTGGSYEPQIPNEKQEILNQNLNQNQMAQQNQPPQNKQQIVGECLNEIQKMIPSYDVVDVLQALVAFLKDKNNAMMRPVVIQQLEKYIPNE